MDCLAKAHDDQCFGHVARLNGDNVREIVSRSNVLKAKGGIVTEENVENG